MRDWTSCTEGCDTAHLTCHYAFNINFLEKKNRMNELNSTNAITVQLCTVFVYTTRLCDYIFVFCFERHNPWGLLLKAIVSLCTLFCKQSQVFFVLPSFLNILFKSFNLGKSHPYIEMYLKRSACWLRNIMCTFTNMT